MYGPIQRIVIELKLLRGSLENVIAQGLAQTVGYATQVGADEAHLVIFNRDARIPWNERIWYRTEHYQQHRVMVWGA